MKTYASILLIAFFIHCIHECVANTNSTVEHYIVYMGTHSMSDSKTVISSNHEMLASIVGSVDHARKAIIHHYHKSFRGFSARLTQEQADEIAKSDLVVSVFKSRQYELQTTRSWDFMGATEQKSIFGNYSVDENYEVVVGHIDSGVWPESPSFNPNDMGPVPSRFKGTCVTGEQFSTSNCNRKLIGARYYHRGYEQAHGRLESNSKGRSFFQSARDDLGHGTHTASTALGRFVTDSNALGAGKTVRGGAPKAQLAVYKVCWFDQCDGSDVLKAFDDAISDQVDVITISVGLPHGPRNYNYLNDEFSIGSFHAFLRGILTVASAGNDGEKGPYTVSNSPPWTLTVAASSTDRQFVSTVQLGDGNTLLQGFGHNKYQMNDFRYVIRGGDAARPGVGRRDARFCKRNALDSGIINGNVVICFMENPGDNMLEKSIVVSDGGGAGMIVVDLHNDYDKGKGEYYPIPTSVINQGEADKLGNYIASFRDPAVKIWPTVENYNSEAPKMGSFSSRGPDATTPEIIKPDITAPGVNILASWPPYSDTPANTPSFVFSFGTSMATPHVSGVAAIIKAFNLGWSPAEIKSALMTTALPVDNTGNPIESNAERATPFDMGSGHLNPNAALDPGLVYDMNADDVFYFLCSRDTPIPVLQRLFGTVNCPNPQTGAYDLNLPSIGINNLVGGISVTRKVTYRGNNDGPKVFNVQIENPQGIEIKVQPSVLDFSSGQKNLTFRVDVNPRQGLDEFVFGSLTWYNNKYSVRSPIAVRALNN
ncbi:hypothetical protein RHSIM_Rhsim03G0077000 [Rhododendron simsii]|uniref:Uncharacterized protein n=1 Tax=Rhododendron simsii TaxID=118357 RepID=A0A834H3F7_RHOSS|nr:hypothetical protein RHSIM_Rhsim03G0077000 [Rhododendron simsii]